MQKFIDRIDRFQQKYRLTAFLYAVVKKYGEDGAGRQAALLTYYGFLSLFPLLMVATTVVNDLVGSHPHLESTLIKGITNYFPLLGSQLSAHVHSLHKNGLPLIIGILFTLYGTRGVAEVFRDGIQRVWGIKKDDEEGFPAGPLKSIAMVLVGGLGFLLASLSAALAAGAGHGWAFRSLSVAVNLVILCVLFIFLLNMSLPKHVSWKETRLGAIIAAVGLLILQSFGTYVLRRQLKSLDALYSYFAIALALLFWIYLQAQMLYYSAEIAVVNNKKLWPRSLTADTYATRDEPGGRPW
jgi:YihY family inner membrane protein